MQSKVLGISIILNVILVCSTIVLGLTELNHRKQIRVLSTVKQEADWDGEIAELGKEKDILVAERFETLLVQFVKNETSVLDFKEKLRIIKEELWKREYRFGQILEKYEELYKVQGLKKDNRTEKTKNKSRLYGSPHHKSMLDICRRSLCSLNEDPLPREEECRRLFLVAGMLDPQAVRLEVTASEGCNIRSEPGKSSDNVIGTVLQGTMLLAKTCHFSWYQVEVKKWFSHKTEENVGWVWDRNVRPAKEGFL